MIQTISFRYCKEDECFFHVLAGVPHKVVEGWVFDTPQGIRMIPEPSNEDDSLTDVKVELMIAHFGMPQDMEVNSRTLPIKVPP